MILDILYSLLLLGGIVFACSVFTNAIEWAGHRFNLSEGAVGSVLAAVGTALPETLVPIVAIVSGLLSGTGITAEAGEAIGIGAILGAPFMLGTLAIGISGLAVLIYAASDKRSTTLNVQPEAFYHDLLWFFPSYGLAVAAAFIDLPGIKPIIAITLLGIYAVYLVRMLNKEDDNTDEEHEALEALWFSPKASEPKTALIMVQIAVGLLGIVSLAHLFVHEIDHLSHQLHIPALILSLVIIPIATELPEKFNSVVWLGKGKDTLALGNLTGAMVFQSCIPTAIGVAFTPWHLEGLALLSVTLCLACTWLMTVFAFRLGRQTTAWFFLLGFVFYGLFVYQVAQQLLG